MIVATAPVDEVTARLAEPYTTRRRSPLPLVISLCGVAAVFSSAYSHGLPSDLLAVPCLAALLIIPGLLALWTIRADVSNMYETLIKAVGVSVAAWMAVGLAVNTGLPALGDDQPLSRTVLSATSVAVLLFAGGIAQIRAEVHLPLGKVLRLRASIRSAPASTLLIVFVSSALIPASVLGARILNAGGTPTLSITTEAAVGLLAPVIILYRRELPSLCLAWALFCQCLALVLLTSLRGNFISGHDILYEFAIFKTTLVHSHWSMLYAHNPYNACLSLTILPVLLVRDVPGLAGEYVFRIIYPILCSLVPVGTFAIARRFVSSRNSYIAGFLFMVSAFLTLDFPYISRQEVGLFFFMALLLAMAVPPHEGRSRHVIVPILAFGLIVSHYSTAYTAVAIMAVAVVVQFAIGRLRREPVKLTAGFVTWWLTGLLTIGVILWQAVLTRATGDIGAFVDAATKSFGGSGSVFAGTPRTTRC